MIFDWKTRSARKAAEVERSPNRAERRAMRHSMPGYRQARKSSRPLRRAFGGWAGAFRPSPWGQG